MNVCGGDVLDFIMVGGLPMHCSNPVEGGKRYGGIWDIEIWEGQGWVRVGRGAIGGSGPLLISKLIITM